MSDNGQFKILLEKMICPAFIENKGRCFLNPAFMRFFAYEEAELPLELILLKVKSLGASPEKLSLSEYAELNFFPSLSSGDQLYLMGELIDFEALIDSLPISVFWMSKNREYRGANKSVLNVFGFENKSDFVGKKIEEILASTKVSAIVRTDTKILHSGEPLVYKEQTIVARPGEHEKTFLTLKAPLQNGVGQVFGLLGLSFDLGREETALVELRKRLAEHKIDAAIKESQINKITEVFLGRKTFDAHALADNLDLVKQFFDSIINTLPASIYWMDSKLRYLGCNNLTVNIFGVKDRQEIIGKTAYDFFSKKVSDGITAVDRSVIENGKSVCLEEKGVDTERRPADYLTNKSPLFDASGNCIGMVGISLDITQLKRTQASLIKAKEAAEKSSKAKSDFLAMMSHELRTPLNVMLGMTHVLSNQELPKPQQHHYLDTIFSAGTALLHIINNILDFSKAESGTLKPHKEIFSIETVFSQLEAELGYKAEEKSLALLMEVGDTPRKLKGDGHRFRQILYNLIDNAMKYTQSGEVSVKSHLVSATEHDCIISVEVRDTGIGIPKKKQSEVFKAFSQIHSKMHDEYARKQGGVGLGLAIVAELVRLLKGNIQVESQLGRGTVFTLQFPFELVSEALQREIDTKNKQILPEKFPGFSVLLVEDNKLNQKVAMHILNSFECDVTLAENGEEALKAMGDQPFDLVLMDLSLPEMSGLEITRVYRASEEGGQHLPIVALTAHVHADDEQKSIDAGMDGFMIKPLYPEKLRKLFFQYQKN